MNKDDKYTEHSKEADEIMGSKPPWIIRWGATALFVIILGVILVTCFVKYPQPDNPDGRLIDYLILPLKSVFINP